jgi:hypothetical protein
MKIKVGTFFIILIILVGVIFVLGPKKISNPPENPVSLNISKTENKQPQVTLIIDDGKHISTYSGIVAGSVFEALTEAAAKNKIDVVTKKYDFGIFVSRIAGLNSGSDLSWIYFINGKSGDVAADKAMLKNGDTVEWKYTKPIF